MMRGPDGTIRQSGTLQNPLDYAHERLAFPVVGVVMSVHFSDDPTNPSAIPISDQRGSYCTCDVYVVGHGNDNPWLIPNVVVLPSGPSGVDDFCEDVPRPCSQMIDGSRFDASMAAMDPSKLDGDWCVVGFIGGSVEQPMMLKWWPHPGNRVDPATAGFQIQTSDGQKDAKTLAQGRRSFRRYAGTKITITNQGSVWVDTNESNATFEGSQDGPTRKKRDEGGDIQVDVKPKRQLQINFNEPVPLPKTEPSLPQPNPPQGERERKTDRTTVSLSEDQISLLAGKICEILTSDDYIDLHAKTKVRMRGDDGNDSVILGDTDPVNCEHTMKGESSRTFINAFINWAVTHTHKTAMGPTDVPTQPFTDRMTDAQLSLAVMVKK